MKIIFLSLLLLALPSIAGNIRFSGQVVDNARSAYNQCLNKAVKFNAGGICASEHGTMIKSNIKNITVLYRHIYKKARIITFNYF